jgi:hypothetical protein
MDFIEKLGWVFGKLHPCGVSVNGPLVLRDLMRWNMLRQRSEEKVCRTYHKKSHPEDSLGHPSKASQKPDNQGTTSTNVEESKGGAKKVRPTPGHVGPRSVSEPDETITKQDLEAKRNSKEN